MSGSQQILNMTDLVERAVSISKSKGKLTLALVGQPDQLLSDGLALYGDHELTQIDSASNWAEQAATFAQKEKIDLIVCSETTFKANLKNLSSRSAKFVKPGQALSQIVLLALKDHLRLLALADTLVNSKPDLATKVKLCGGLINMLKALGNEQPKVAALAAVEVVYPQMPVTIDGAALAKMSELGQIKGGLVDGPLSFDVAMDQQVAFDKGIKNSSVAGQADALLAPNAQIAAGIWQGLAIYGQADFAALVVGGLVPILVISSLDSPQTIRNSLALARLF